MESKLNNTVQSLLPLTSFVGSNEVVSGFTSIVCNLFTTKDCVITCDQSIDGVEYNFTDNFTHVVSVFGTQTRTQFYAKAYYIRISVFNPNLEDIPKIVMTTMFSNENRVSTIEQPNFITGDVVVTSAMKAKDYTDNSIRDVACDSSGNLKINVNIDDLSPTDDGVMTYGSNDGTTPLVIKTDDTGHLDVVLDNTKVGETGNQFLFIPTATNNTVAIYADGAPGITVTGGWRYTNNPSATLKKINWYVYQSPLAETSYKVSQLKNIYCVINNITTSNKLPFFAFYTRATGSGDGASWYKSRIILSASNTTGTGVKFLYTGEDPVLIHPEITGVNRIQLVWDPISSTKTLELAKDENIFTSTLQTDSSTGVVGSFDFVFQEYGIVWEKKKVFLPVEFDKLQIKGDVSVSNFPATQPVSGTIAVSNFPAPVTSVAVNNLAPIELKLDDSNTYLQNITVVTNRINNNLNYLPQQETIIDIPITTMAGDVVSGSQFNLLAVTDNDVRYRNAIYLGSVNASVNTTPKLVFQYSDDETNWFSDGVSCSFYKPTGSSVWEFAFQRSGLGVKYVRLVAQTTTTINYLALNLSV